MPYDQLLKDVLRTFFAEFMEQFFPEAAARLDLRDVTFLEQELATELGEATRRELDLVAQVATRSGEPELILVHVELQARPAPGFPARMYRYYALLRQRHGLPVLPIVVYVTGGKGRRKWQWYQEAVLHQTVLWFRCRQLRLKALKADEASRGGSPLVCALAVLMDRRGADPAVLKAQSLDGIGRSSLDEARRWFLAHVVETYLPLTGAAQQRYRELLQQEEHQVAKEWDFQTWREQMRQEARQEARQEGRQEGTIQAKQDDILTVVQARFASVPAELERRVKAIAAPADLDALLIRVATASSLDDVSAALPH